MKKYRRRNYLINKSLQLRYMGMVTILMMIISVIISWAIYVTTWDMLLDKLEGVANLDTLIIDLTKPIIIKTCLLVLVSVVLGAFMTMFIVHRIAGPLFRVKRIMRQIEEGVLPRGVKFRKGDELQDVASAIDGAVRKIGEVSEKNLKVVEEASACVESAIGSLESEKTKVQRDLKEKLEELRNHLEEFEIFKKESS